MDKRIFVTAATFDGNLDGIGGADLKCNADTNKPGVGTYKAMIAGESLRSAFPPVDWVLTAGTSYFRPADEVFIARALTDAVFTFPLNAPIQPRGGRGRVWTGLVPPWTTSSSVCDAEGVEFRPWRNGRPILVGGAFCFADISGVVCGVLNCDDVAGLYCVEQ
ncbi:MAG: DUF1554 domain-containing protein [Halioglobus sp.]